MITLVIAIVIVIILLTRVRMESYDYREIKSSVTDIVDSAFENDGFNETNIMDLRSILEPVMKNDEEILEIILDYAAHDKVDEVSDIVQIYFDAYIKAR
tara:strand:- start:3096 stop:3392 length:297 start_codon:yes stop_codon:yes gene_type:complete